jgi:hypothetical protein
VTARGWIVTHASEKQAVYSAERPGRPTVSVSFASAGGLVSAIDSWHERASTDVEWASTAPTSSKTATVGVQLSASSDPELMLEQIAADSDRRSNGT